MGFATTFVTRRTLGGVKMGSLGIPLPLVVNMPCPGQTVYGEPPTFTATVDQSATFTIYLDEVPIASTTGKTSSISYIPDPNIAVGPHSVKVTARTDTGEGSATCSWDVVEPMPSVTMNCPDNSVIDLMGSSRTFSATISAASRVLVAFIPAHNPLGAVVIPYQMIDGSETLSFTINSNNIGDIAESDMVGMNTVKVIASNSSGSRIAICPWRLRQQWPTISMECPRQPSEYRMPPTFVASVDYPATITITVLNNADEVLDTKSGFGKSLSFTPNEEIMPGTYTVRAVAENDFGTGNEVSCPWIVEEGSLKIWRFNPEREMVIDALVNRGAARQAVHVFNAQTNRSDAKMEINAVNLDNGSSLEITQTGPASLGSGLFIEADIRVNYMGKFKITASAEVEGEKKSVSWEWVVSEQIVSCSTSYVVPGEGLYIHLCSLDANAITVVLEGISAVVGAEAPLLGAALAIEVGVMRVATANPEDESVDIFIPNASLALIAAAYLSPTPIPIPIKIGSIYTVIFM